MKNSTEVRILSISQIIPEISKTNNYFVSVSSSPQQSLLPRLQTFSTDDMDGIASSKRAINDRFHQTTPYSLLVQSLIKQLCNFLETDKERSSNLYNKICAKLFEMKFIDESYEKSEFENIRMSYEIALKQLVEATRGNTLPVQELEMWPLTHDNPKTALEWSRYHRDFEEIEKIGEGGFGDVWKSKHKLDRIDYAVKKICVKATSVKNILNHLREVKTLASLDHKNIIPYKSCWLEPLISYQKEEKFVDTFQTSASDSSTYISQSHAKEDSLRLKSDSFTVDFQYSHENEEKSQQKSKSSSADGISQMDKIRRLNAANGALVPHVKLTWAVLYIQMKLCQKTLRHFLDERNENRSFDEYYKQYHCYLRFPEDDSEKKYQMFAYRVFEHLCKGLEYIHTKEIVHHDIKPPNVFISTEENGELIFQLGDFGLACPLEEKEVVERHDGIGTRLYAAAEQLDGQCSKKSDIYSLGVILIELLSRCITMMECYKKVEKLKKCERLTDIDKESCDLITKLLSRRPESRPDISELKRIVSQKLESSNEVSRLKKTIYDKDNELHKKDQQIDELMTEISKLRTQLSNS